MNCFNHHELSAIAQCQDCSKGLCNECATKYSIPICSICNSSRGKSEKDQIIKELFWTYGLGLGLTFLVSRGSMGQMTFGNNSIETSLMFFMMFYMCSGLVAGWYTLNRITPQVFLFLPLIGWVIYFVIKMMISIWVGLIMLPVRTCRNVRRIRQINAIPI